MEKGKEFSTFEKSIGYSFKDTNLLQQAFVHRSYLNENKGFAFDHNERLEFLGDAVLELIVTDYLYHHYQLPEGELTNLRAALVRGEMLSLLAVEVGMEPYMLLSRGEQKGSDKARQYIVANAFEALIGALYLDGGYEAVRTFISRVVLAKLPEIISKGLYVDSKSRFQELAQERFRITPTYEVLREDGLDHAKQFVVGLFLGSRKVSEGSGSSKQEAQQAAARLALDQLAQSTL